MQVVVRLFSLHRTREHKPVDISIQVFEAAFNLLFVILELVDVGLSLLELIFKFCHLRCRSGLIVTERLPVEVSICEIGLFADKLQLLLFEFFCLLCELPL